jgi:hypothetical protein
MTGRPAPWPDDLDDWLGRCHDAGQTRSSPLLLGRTLGLRPPRRGMTTRSGDRDA